MGGTSEQGWSSQRPLSGARLRAGMRGKLPEVVKLPPSVTVPFSSFEEALKQKENAAMAKRLEAAVKAIPETNAEDKLRECREVVMEARHRPCSTFWISPSAEICCSDSVLENEKANLTSHHVSRQGPCLCKQSLSGPGCMLTLCDCTHRWSFRQSWRSS